jgi:HTH-type transcriptional regulator/antitoxin HigA
MKQAIGQIRFADLPDDYAGLCRRHLPRPIRDRMDYQNTTEITDALTGHDLAPDQEDYFALLCSLIEDYDRERLPIPARKISGLAALQHLLDENGMTAADLARLLGVHRTLGAMILRGERQMTLAHVRTLAERFKVSSDLFIERPA